MTQLRVSEPAACQRGGLPGSATERFTRESVNMFISKKYLDRRTFLHGMGATVALPLLDAMIPARTLLAATAARPMPRMAFVYFPHGAIMDAWTPAAAGREIELGPILEPLTPFKNRLTILSGLENRHAYGPVHAITPGTWLSGVSPRASSDPAQGATADQMAADHISQETPLPSIAVATEEPKRIGAGIWVGKYAESYSRTISFRRASTPLPMEFNPRTLFDELFDRSATAAGRAGGSTSVLDLVAPAAADLRRRLGPVDRARLGNYLDTVRDIERRVERADARMRSSVVSQADGANRFVERMTLMFDLIALAFRADITRVASVMMAAEASSMTYDHLGVPDSFHLLSHHQNDPAKIEKLVRIQTFHTRMFATFIQSLADLPDGDGSMLDRSLILYGSNMSNSNAHDHFPLPLAVIGGGCGTLRGGQHVRYPDRTPVSNLLLAILHRGGVPVESIGDSTGECAEL
ncbi:MAG: DUF1552 domain-containing protein [Vicinamibacterales bacterium]